MKKSLLLLCTAAFLLMSASCGNSTAKTEVSLNDQTAGETAVPEETGTATVDYFAEDVDYGSYEFRILHRIYGYSCYNYENQVSNGVTGELLNDAVFNRNAAVEEKYNVKISEICSDQVSKQASNSIAAGDDAYDLVLERSHNLSGLIAPGRFLELNSVPNLHLDEEWWEKNGLDSFAVNGGLYMATSDLMITHYETTTVLFWNKKLAESLDMPDFYGLVRDGKWTLDQFSALTKDVKSDIDGDGKYNKNDRWALCGWYGVTNTQWFVGSGASSVGTASDGSFVSKLSEKTYSDRYEKVIETLKECKVTTSDKNPEHLTMFRSDLALFFSGCVGEASDFRDMESNYGYLPAPKYDEAQKNYITYSNYPVLILIPTTVGDPARTGRLLDYLSYEGSQLVIPAFYDQMILSKYIRDEESVDMLQNYIFNNRIYEVGTDIISGKFADIPSLCSTKDTLGTFLAKEQYSLAESIEKYIQAFQTEG